MNVLRHPLPFVRGELVRELKGVYMNLLNKVAIVTGSARGIGKAIALKLAEDGADIVVNDIPAALNDLEVTANEIRGLNRKALAITADVSSAAEVNKMMRPGSQRVAAHRYPRQ